MPVLTPRPDIWSKSTIITFIQCMRGKYSVSECYSPTVSPHDLQNKSALVAVEGTHNIYFDTFAAAREQRISRLKQQGSKSRQDRMPHRLEWVSRVITKRGWDDSIITHMCRSGYTLLKSQMKLQWLVDRQKQLFWSSINHFSNFLDKKSNICWFHVCHTWY